MTYADFAQAFDRVHRLGQEHECTATVFCVTWGTASDPNLLALLLRSRDIFSRTLNGVPGDVAWDWHLPAKVKPLSNLA